MVLKPINSIAREKTIDWLKDILYESKSIFFFFCENDELASKNIEVTF